MENSRVVFNECKPVRFEKDVSIIKMPAIGIPRFDVERMIVTIPGFFGDKTNALAESLYNRIPLPEQETIRFG